MSDEKCPDCAAGKGELHRQGCDVERCAFCGGQANSFCCGMPRGRRLAWSGRWPGEEECEAFGWYAKLVPRQGWVQCSKDDEGAGPDLNRLLRDAKWDADAGCFVKEDSSGNGPPDSKEAVFFARIKKLSQSAEANAEDVRVMAEQVRGIAIADWPASWSSDELIAVAAFLKVEPQELISQMKARHPNNFRKGTD